MLVLLLACADLPDGWENARRIDDFHQEQCEGSAYDTGVVVAVTASAEADATAVAATNVGFRCAQDVEGFWQDGDAGVEVLVQPIDMDPAAVAACDCLYALDMTVPSLADVVAFYTRGDHLSGRDEPTLLGTADVQ